ncbi:unnamed protein product [Dovyalis caffra]|uniref:Pectinesterase inhibitor domain-containing protein n=1 Tax=Dovyalis caffra TaxID=77055 RepID=A0AAV1S5Z7_9ROSI|nr:unnamed protein product [Dovyalis caffra]
MAANAPSKLIQDICTQAVKFQAKYDNCVSALELDPKAASADVATLAKISIKLGISNITDTQNYIKNLLKNASAELQKPLKTCLSWYEAATNSFKSAFLELTEDPLTANYDSKIAGDDVQLCEDELAREKAQIPEVTTRSNYGKLYSTISFLVTDRL